MATVRELRLAKGWTQEELAHAAGLSWPVISRMENSKPVNKSSLKHVARALGVSPDVMGGVVVGGKRVANK